MFDAGESDIGKQKALSAESRMAIIVLPFAFQIWILLGVFCWFGDFLPQREKRTAEICEFLAVLFFVIAAQILRGSYSRKRFLCILFFLRLPASGVICAPHKEYHLLLKCLGRGSHHRGQRKFPHQLVQREPQKHRVRIIRFFRKGTARHSTVSAASI